MAKKKNWFNLVKKFFLLETQSKQEKEGKTKRWIFGRMKTKRLPTLTAPLPSKERGLSGAEEEQRKHSLTAAINAAQAAAEVVWLNGMPESSQQFKDNAEDVTTSKSQSEAPHSTCQCHRKIEESAAIKIQTAFRGYLARKALQALKGIVKLQAIIRGTAVRRQAMSTLKCLQSIVNIQSQVCAKRNQIAEGRWNFDENEEQQGSRDKVIRVDSSCERRWDDSILLKEDADASHISKNEAASKRERIKEYMFNHRKSAESERINVNGRWRYWLEQWVDTQLGKSKELEDLESVFSSNSKAGDECGERQLKLRNFPRRNHVEGLDSPSLAPRKSFNHRKQCSIGDGNSLSSTSPKIPTYMAATESAKAKARSTSSPKLRTLNLDTSSESNSPSKNKLSLISSINSELPSSVRMGKHSGHQQRSPSMKGLSVPIKSNRTAKDLSFNSDCSLLNWDRQSPFR
ncbi:Protein IQ-DOMAIN like [Quillaja saponaria]|uniref:Protein IQ-DOMAIN like n=1 Tax=Quillaja saponaria TaxID=32244 RepID=A0AAD7L1T6_QUISA|nr:Protein IQ-DOMAIN like [Quillaja saponaria]